MQFELVNLSGWAGLAGADTCAAPGEGRLLPQGSDKMSPARPLLAALQASRPNPLQFWAISHADFSAFCPSLV